MSADHLLCRPGLREARLTRQIDITFYTPDWGKGGYPGSCGRSRKYRKFLVHWNTLPVIKVKLLLLNVIQFIHQECHEEK